MSPAASRAANEARCARLLERSALLVHDDLDWSAVPATEVDPEVLACLVYMRDVEGFTDRYLVGLAAHRTTLADPLLARFLDVWRAEEGEHARALERFLDAYAARGVALPSRQAPPPPDAGRLERVVSRVGGPVGTVVAAGHMAWGAANELLTLTGYRLLADRCGHPVLRELLTRIAAQESRHYAFYLLQAEWRLAASPTARAALRGVLSRAWTPVGVGDGFKTHAEFGRVLTYLRSSPAGQHAVDRMDARFSALPGFAGLRIYRRAAEAYGGAKGAEGLMTPPDRRRAGPGPGPHRRGPRGPGPLPPGRLTRPSREMGRMAHAPIRACGAWCRHDPVRACQEARCRRLVPRPARRLRRR